MELYIGTTLIGILAGFIAGLLGLGGGIVVVPALILLFRYLQFPEEHVVHLAIGTSLATIVFTSLSSIRAHHLHRHVNWQLFKRLTGGLIAGAAFGAVLADHLPSTLLARVFGLFMLIFSIYMLLDRKPPPGQREPGWLAASASGSLIGTLSSLIGIGGGSMMVPYLMWSNLTTQRAVGTSAACGLPIALSGSAGFLLAGTDQALLPQYSLGYIYLPAFISIVVFSVLFAPMGAKLASHLPANTLKKIFTLFMMVVALDLLITG